MLKSMNYVRMLHLFLIYQKATLGDLFQEWNLHEGIKTYIIGEKWYLLLPWLMVPHKQIWMCHYVLKVLYNKWLSHAKVVVENHFGILKKTFKELMIKSNLNVLFLLDVVIYYCMLHNMILNGKDFNINELVLQLEKQKMCQKIKKVWWGEILIKGH
jgi:hypothetical protein